MSSIVGLCRIFLKNSNKSYVPSDFKDKDFWNYNSVKVHFKRLKEYGIIKQLPSKRYMLKDEDKAILFITTKSYNLRQGSKTPPPHRIRAKAHNLYIGTIDLSGDPIDWLIKMNMLTKPSPGDPAKNVILREGIAKKFNMRISLSTYKAVIYPKTKGWDTEFLGIFDWCKDFINRLGNITENMEIAVNYEDLMKINPNLRDIPFEEVKGLILESDGMKIQLCRSQFPEGEICLHSNTIEETISLADKITYGNRNLSQALHETSLENSIKKDLEAIKQAIDDLPRVIALTISPPIKDAVKEGIKEAYKDLSPPQRPDHKIDVV